MQKLKADVANQELVFGPFLDKTDGVTPETAISAPTAARIWKEGVTSTINLSTGRTPAWTHDGDGYYTVGSLASDVDTEGRLRIEITDAATHLPVWEDFEVVATNPYDALLKGTDKLQVDTVEVSGVAQTGNDNGADINTILARIIGTLAAGTHNPQSGDAYARLGAPVGASISADIQTVDSVADAIKAITDALPNSGALTDIDTGVNNIEGKLPSKSYLAGSNNADGDIQLDEATGNLPNISVAIQLAIERIYRFLMNKMNITDSSGAVALRNESDTGNIMTQTITDDDTTTVRTAAAWV